MKKQLISIAIASTLLSATALDAYASDQQVSNNKHKQYIGTGIGATAGALVAGPVGFIVGGLIGNLAGKHDAMEDNTPAESATENEQTTEATSQPATVLSTENEATELIIVAQLGEIETIIDDESVDHSSALNDLMLANMSLDVFFLTGSTALETFYQPRIQAISNLMQQMPDIDAYLEGYSDRRGDKDTNLALSNERLNAVHHELVQAGVDPARIQMKAFGEQQFISKPGKLEAYTFDRRVVIRFELASPASKSPIALIESKPSP
jgi:sortase system peptidoglycan-associated protein